MTVAAAVGVEAVVGLAAVAGVAADVGVEATIKVAAVVAVAMGVRATVGTAGPAAGLHDARRMATSIQANQDLACLSIYSIPPFLITGKQGASIA